MSLFLKRRKNQKGSTSWKKKQPAQPASSQPTELYLTCSQLPLDKFINCLIDGDKSQLVIKGSASDDQLIEAWNLIYIEYIQLNQSNESLYVIRMESEIALLNDEINRVSEIIYLLTPEMVPFCDGRENELLAILHYYGYRQTINFNSDYSKVLIGIQSKLAPKKLRLQSRLNELGDYKKAQQTGKPDRSIFEKNLIRMSRFMGYPLRAKEITVAEYVMIFKDCFSANENQKEEEK